LGLYNHAFFVCDIVDSYYEYCGIVGVSEEGVREF
jgi:hypothetical protein